MAFVIQQPSAGYPQIGDVIADDGYIVGPPLGTIVTAADPDYGSGEFIYLAGVASTVVGSFVKYNPDDFSTSLAVADDNGSFAIAMGATVANTKGWYQIKGKASVKALSGFLDNAVCYLTATAGSIDDAAVSGDLIRGMVGASAVDDGVADVEIDYPRVIDILATEIPDDALSADATGRAKMADDFFNEATVDDKFEADAIDEDRIKANTLNGRVAANVADDNVIGGLPVLHRIDIADAASDNVEITLTHKTRVVDVWVVKREADGHASEDTIVVGAGANAITDAMAIGANDDKSITRAGEIDDANHEIAAAGALRVTWVKGSGGGNNVACTVYVLGVRVA